MREHATSTRVLLFAPHLHRILTSTPPIGATMAEEVLQRLKPFLDRGSIRDDATEAVVQFVDRRP